MKNFMSFQLASLSLIQEDKTFAALAEKYQPKEGVNYLGFTFHGSVPLINMKAMAITPATMAKSLKSAEDMMVDFEHKAEDIPIPRDDDDYGTEVVGHIKEVVMGDIPSLDNAEAWALAPYVPAEPILSVGVMVLYTRIAKVRHIAQQVQRGAPWYFSLEIGDGVSEPAIWLQGNKEQPHEIIPWSEAPEDLRSIASQPKMMEYSGRNVAYLMGGADGFVPFIGGAITRNPAGFEQRQPGNSLQFFASADGAIQGAGGSIWKTETWKEAVKNSLKTGKEEDGNGSDDCGIIAPIMIGSIEDLLEVVAVVSEIKTASDNDNNSGGDKMELTQEELDAKLKEAKAAGFTEGKTAGITEGEAGVLEKAVTDGTHIPADQVEGILAKRILSSGRESVIKALPCDAETQADFLTIASNAEKYPLDEDGEAAFTKALARWASTMKPAPKVEDLDEHGKPKKTASVGADGKPFDMGNGGGSGGTDDEPPAEIPAY